MSELIDKVRTVLTRDSRERSVSDVLADFADIPEVGVELEDIGAVKKHSSDCGVILSVGQVYSDGVILKPQFGGNFAYLHRNDERVVYHIHGPIIKFS
jgi:hypothetical protein